MNRKKALNFTVDIIFDIVGSFLYAVGIICFVNPADLAPGGVSGIAIMLNYLWNLPIGLMTFVINIPLLILSWVFLGHSITLKTLKTMVISTVMMDLIVSEYIPVYAGDRMISAMFGGIIMGAGLAVIFLRGSTTAGTDIISFLIRKWRPHLPIGQILMLIDCTIVAASIPVFGNLESGLYALIAMFCSSRVIDGIIYGMDKGSMVTVVSDKNNEIANSIMKDLDRGVTLLRGRGGYTGKDRDVLICAVRKQQFGRMRSLIYDIDPSAFVVVNETTEILEEGFRDINEE